MQYALEGNIPHTGDAIAWMLDIAAMPSEDEAPLSELPVRVPDSGGVYFVPALTGAGAPWWDEQARGVICGLSRGTRREHLVRAAFESVAYQIADVIGVLRQQPGFALQGLMADGGPSRNDWLMQFQADLLGCPVWRSNWRHCCLNMMSLNPICSATTSCRKTTARGGRRCSAPCGGRRRPH
jgi:glycerol kinase